MKTTLALLALSISAPAWASHAPARIVVAHQTAGPEFIYSLDGVREVSTGTSNGQHAIRFDVLGKAEGNLCTGDAVFAEVDPNASTDEDRNTASVRFRVMETNDTRIRLGARACPQWAAKVPFTAKFELSWITPGPHGHTWVYQFVNGPGATAPGPVEVTLSPQGSWSVKHLADAD